MRRPFVRLVVRQQERKRLPGARRRRIVRMIFGHAAKHRHDQKYGGQQDGTNTKSAQRHVTLPP